MWYIYLMAYSPKAERLALVADHAAAIGAVLADQRPRSLRVDDVRRLFERHRRDWDLPASLRPNEFLEVLVEEGLLQPVRLRHENEAYRDRESPRFLVDGCTALEIASSLRTNGYLSHGTAVFVHGLGEQVPRTFYVNDEQSAKPPPSGELTQAAIDRTFARKQRVSKFVLRHGDDRFTILNGKRTDGLGVVEITGPSGEPLRVTDLERTLIDIVVRPVYAGGLYEVLVAYEYAVERGVSVERLVELLGALGHRYPYHQSVGFMLERAGADPKLLEPLRELGLEYDFYLSYQMPEPVLDASWRVHHPEGF